MYYMTVNILHFFLHFHLFTTFRVKSFAFLIYVNDGFIAVTCYLVLCHY